MKDEISRKIINYLQQANGQAQEIDNIQADTSLIGSALLDSIGFLELILFLENEFQVELELGEHEPELFSTFGGLVSIVESALPNKAVSS